jgi:hypothetical protein
MTLRGGVAAIVIGVALTPHARLGAQAVDRGLATAIEQALIEQACAPPPSAPIVADGASHDECLHARLDSLRADFGRDLGRLSSADRRAIDSACAPIRAVQGREGYVNCLARQLAVIRNRAGRTRAATPDASRASDPTPAMASASGAGVETTIPATTNPLPPLLMAVAAIVAVACAVALMWRLRRLRRACQVCGTRIGNDGDLCTACRHQAAETLRRAAAERVELQRAQENDVRRQRERDEEERRRVAREAEETRLQQLALARRREDEAAEQARRRDAEDAAERERAAAADAAAPTFDPYTVLGIPRDAPIDAVRAAFEQARSKYDLEQVADLGLEVREHYIAKAAAAERAYQMLAEALSGPAEPEPLHDQAPLLDPHQASVPLAASS